MSKSLRESIEFAVNNKELPATSAKQLGVATFSECKEAVDTAIVDNSTNRDEELDSESLYISKLHHLIRYVCGVSEKGQLMISVLRDRADKVGYIRDNGTMFGLCFGEYFNLKQINGHIWMGICEDIINEYGVDEKDSEFINLIQKYFKSLPQSKLDLDYSLFDVINHSSYIKKIYYDTTIAFSVNLMSRKQHQCDMINCNKQPNPWNAYNFYMTVHKDTKAYRTSFLGNDLLKWVQGKEGLSEFSKGKLMNSYQSTANLKKVNVIVPLIIAYCITNYVDTIDELNNAYRMIVKFPNHNDKEVNKYWTNMFGKMVKDASYKDIQDFYIKHYIRVFNSDKWDYITDTIKSIVKQKCGGTESTSMQGLHIKKFDTGMWFLSVILWFKNKNAKYGYDKLIDNVVSEYIKLLNGNVVFNDTGEIAVYAYFGTYASLYKTASSEIRMDKLFQYVTKELNAYILNRTDDRNDEAKYRESALNKMCTFVDDNGINPILYAYPVSTTVLYKFNIKTGEKLHWLHKNPHSNGGNSKDGFLGLIDDNLDGNMKYKNWEITQSEYWKLIINRNNEELPKITDRSIAKKIEYTNSILEEMIEIDLTA